MSTEITLEEAKQLLESMKPYFISLNPMDEADKFNKLTQHFKQQEIADALGISRGYIFKRLSLLSLMSELQDLVREGHLAPNTGYELSHDSKEAQTEWLGEYWKRVEVEKVRKMEKARKWEEAQKQKEARKAERALKREEARRAKGELNE